MKTALVTLIILVASCAGVFGQNFAVRFYGTNSAGLPRFWPAQVQPLGTNTTAALPFVLMAQSALDNCISTNAAAYSAWQSNQSYQVQAALDAKIAALVQSYSNLQWCAENWSSVTNLNTLKIAVKAQGEVLLDLKPVLQQLYHGE